MEIEHTINYLLFNLFSKKKTLRVFVLLSSVFILTTSLHAKEVLEKKQVSNGEVEITVEGETYKLPLVRCYRVENTFKGKPNIDLKIRTHKSRKSKGSGPRFSALGRGHSERSKIYYSVSVKGGANQGGTDYKGQIPFKYLDGKILHYAGKSSKREMKLGKLMKTITPIEFTASCK